MYISWVFHIVKYSKNSINLITIWSCVSSPQTFWHFRIDHHQSENCEADHIHRDAHPHSALKALLKTFRKFRILQCMSHKFSLLSVAINLLLQTLMFLCLASLCVWHTNCALGMLTQICMPDTQWDQANWNTGVDSREKLFQGHARTWVA